MKAFISFISGLKGWLLIGCMVACSWQIYDWVIMLQDTTEPGEVETVKQVVCKSGYVYILFDVDEFGEFYHETGYPCIKEKE